MVVDVVAGLRVSLDAARGWGVEVEDLVGSSSSESASQEISSSSIGADAGGMLVCV